MTKTEKLSAESVLIISILLISAFVCFLNETLLGVALPAIMQDLNITASVGQWLNTAYMLTMAIVIPITGYLQQRFSTRALYVAAMAAFVQAGAGVRLGCDHTHYPAHMEVPAPTLASLAGDLNPA